MTYKTTGTDKVERLVGAEVQEYQADDMNDALSQLRSDVASLWGDAVAADVDATMLEIEL